MKSKRTKSRKREFAPNGLLGPKLAAYSATAAAALALAPNAHAQVVLITSFNYSGNTKTTTPPSFAPPPTLTPGALAISAGPFRFSFSGTQSHQGEGGQLKIIGQASLSIAAQVQQVAKLRLGSAIKAQASFNGRGFFAYRNYNNPSNSYPFQPGPNGAITGYVGLKGNHLGHNYYGWLKVKVTADGSGDVKLITLVAKNGDPGVFGAYLPSTTPGADTFGAGDTSVAAVPEPADAAVGLGLLAFGAAGVREMRRRKKAA